MFPGGKIDFRYLFAYAVGVERARKTRMFLGAEGMGIGQDIPLEKLEEVFSRLEFTKDGSLIEWAEWRFQQLADFVLGQASKNWRAPEFAERRLHLACIL